MLFRSLDGSSASGAGHGNDGSGSHGGDDDASMAGNVFGRVPSDYSWNGFHNAAGKAMEYLSRAGKGEVSVGVPVYFFFRFDSTDLTDKAQMINLDAIAQVAEGGIGKFSPPAVNRQCKVELIVN